MAILGPGARIASDGAFSPEKDDHIFSISEPETQKTPVSASFRGCEGNAAMRYLDALETVSLESIFA